MSQPWAYTLDERTQKRGRNRLGLYPILVCRRAMPLQIYRTLELDYLTSLKLNAGIRETAPPFCS